MTNLQGADAHAVNDTWYDSIYLSHTGTYSPADPLIGRVTNKGIVSGHGTYNGSLTASLPGVVPGNYSVIVIADSQGDVPDVDRSNNTRASTKRIAVDVTAIQPGMPVSGTIKSGADVYYRVDLPAGPVARITANLGSAGGAELHVRYQNVPTTAIFDQVAFDPNHRQQQILLNGTQAGTYYLLLHGREASGGGDPFQLVVQDLSFQVLNVTPSYGSNVGRTTVTVQGSQLSPATAVGLVGAGGTMRQAQVLFKDSSTLFATFDLTGLATGSYDVQIADHGQTATDRGAFTVNNGVAGQVAFGLSASQYTNNNNPGSITITYSNPGNTDAPAPLMILSSDNASFKLPCANTGTPDSVELLGINQGGPAGIVPPGYHNTITLTFCPPLGAHTTSHFALSSIPSADTPFDWSSVEADLRPPDVPLDAWAAIYQNFTTQVGGTLGQYQQALDNDATYLSQLGEYTVDVSRLLSFELQKADDFGAISQRYTLGAFGRGWPDPTNIHAVTDASGNVTIEYSGRVRSFFKQANGTYQGVPGDAATLTLNNGVYTLRETDGTLTVFNANGTLNYTQDTNGNRITAHYTGGLLTSFVDSTNNDTVQFGYTSYNGQERITSVTDPVGRKTMYGYDPTGQYLMTVTDANGTTSYHYVPGQSGPTAYALDMITYPDQTHTYFTYDAQGRLKTQSADGGAELVNYAYNEGSISVTDADHGTSIYFVNEFEQVGAYEDPLSQFTHYVYDANHHLVRETGPDGITSTFTVNAAGDTTAAVDPQGNQIIASYDSVFHELTSLTDPNGNTTRYGYNSTNGNLLSITYPDSSQEQFTYDPTGNLMESVDRNGIPIHYVYDPVTKLLKEEDLAGGTKITFGYDAHRNLKSAAINNNPPTAFDYDAQDRLTKVTYPNGMYLMFHYNSLGQRDWMKDQTGYTVNYKYDIAGRLRELDDGSGHLIVRYSYSDDDAAHMHLCKDTGRLCKKELGNGTYTEYSYDPAGNLTKIANYAANGSVISQYDYTYDRQGRPTSVTVTLNGTMTTTRYTYDADGQLTSVTLPSGEVITYHYDAAGNRTAVIDMKPDGSTITSTYTTNNLNEYTQVVTMQGTMQSTTRYRYDQDGNLISQTDSLGTTIYSYNDLGQLTSVVSPQGTWTYQYDALGNRISSTVNGQTTQYLIDPTGIGNVVGEFNGSGGVIAHYTQGLGLTSRVDASGAAAYYNFDLTGNTTELTGANGAVLNRYSYLPFGEMLSATGSTPNPFTFVGQFGGMSSSGNQYFMRLRLYDSALGRFTRPDPVGLGGGDTNLYRSVSNQPTDNIDPTGLVKVHQLAKGACGIYAGIKEIVMGIAVGSSLPLEGPATPFGAFVTVVLIGGGGSKVGAGGANVVASFSATKEGEGEVPQSFLEGVGAAFPRYKRAAQLTDLLLGGLNLSGDPVDIGCFFHDLWQDPTIGPQLKKLLLSLLQKLRALATAQSDHLVNGDPNKLIGPHGYGPSRFVSATQTLTYKIDFRNERKADIPVQKVVITEQLDPSLDWTTFQVGDFTIAGTTYAVPPNDGFYRTRLDLISTLGIYLDVTAGIDLTTGVVTWTFTSIDPTTGDLPTSFFIGFLPPDKNPPAGEASVTYTIRPKPDDPTGTVINAQAGIVFDTNDSVPTKVVANTIDAAPPSSTVAPLRPIKHRPNFIVRWSGNDDEGGSGIAFYDIYVATDDGPFVLWLAGTTATSAVFEGAFGHRYSFYSVATDNGGNQEATPDGAQAMTDVEPRHSGEDGPEPGRRQGDSLRGPYAISAESGLPDATSTGVVPAAGVETGAARLFLAAPMGISGEAGMFVGERSEVTESAGQAIEAVQAALAWEMGDQPVGVETPSPGERLLHRSGLSEEPGWDDLVWLAVDTVFQEAAGWGS